MVYFSNTCIYTYVYVNVNVHVYVYDYVYVNVNVYVYMYMIRCISTPFYESHPHQIIKRAAFCCTATRGPTAKRSDSKEAWENLGRLTVRKRVNSRVKIYSRTLRCDFSGRVAAWVAAVSPFLRFHGSIKGA